MEKLCVLGLGYIGLPTAAMFAISGLQVHGMDININIVETLHKKDIHIEEPGLKSIVVQALETGNLTVSHKVEPADAFIIAVPTPFKKDRFGEYDDKRYKLADMDAVCSAVKSILPYLQQGNLVILESTSPVRTTIELIQPILETIGMKAGEDFYLAYSPERVLPGQILKELVENSRVVGGINKISAEKGKELYSRFVRGEIITTNSQTAEMVKLMENTYRDVNIAIANEFSRLADRFSVDIWEAISIANRHPRVKILKPGPGVGGHCISVDPWFLVESAPDVANLIFQARIVNDTQPDFIVNIVKKYLGELEGKKIALLGLSYKPDVDDFRESPSIEILKLLQRDRASVLIYDPYAKDNLVIDMPISMHIEEATKSADLILLLVDHAEFKALTPRYLRTITSARFFIDTVGSFTKAPWDDFGFIFDSMNHIFSV